MQFFKYCVKYNTLSLYFSSCNISTRPSAHVILARLVQSSINFTSIMCPLLQGPAQISVACSKVGKAQEWNYPTLVQVHSLGTCVMTVLPKFLITITYTCTCTTISGHSTVSYSGKLLAEGKYLVILPVIPNLTGKLICIVIFWMLLIMLTKFGNDNSNSPFGEIFPGENIIAN